MRGREEEMFVGGEGGRESLRAGEEEEVVEWRERAAI
jgi:hypothetical protein